MGVVFETGDGVPVDGVEGDEEGGVVEVGVRGVEGADLGLAGEGREEVVDSVHFQGG